MGGRRLGKTYIAREKINSNSIQFCEDRRAEWKQRDERLDLHQVVPAKSLLLNENEKEKSSVPSLQKILFVEGGGGLLFFDTLTSSAWCVCTQFEV